ncbi:MAG TPA: hypothetical protein VHP37_33050 [Burkholderiales bacterium]|nr:hypothetical protein [Burkholderiales bacterium]
MPTSVLILTMLRAIVEVAGFAMLGQALLYVLAGRRRKDNFVYQLFSILTRPVIRFTRWITPRFVRDDHIGIAAFLLLLWLWVGLLIAKRYVCLTQALACPGM